jgi:hypothetical protein
MSAFSNIITVLCLYFVKGKSTTLMASKISLSQIPDLSFCKFYHNIPGFQSYSPQSLSGADWGQKASAAIGFIETETLRKMPHITLKSLNSTKNVFKKPRNPWKSLNFSEKVFKNN